MWAKVSVVGQIRGFFPTVLFSGCCNNINRKHYLENGYEKRHDIDSI